MAQIEQQFLNLLQSGLWQQEACADLFRETTDWSELFRLSKEQSVVGIVYDGMLTLPRECKPSRAFLMNWQAQVSYIEDVNRSQIQTLLNVHKMYCEQNATPVLLLGQSVALSYPQPLHRDCGDVDWFLSKDDYSRINQWLIENNVADSDREETTLQMEYHFEGQIIENHRTCINLYRFSARKYLQKLTEKWFALRTSRVVIDGEEILVPPTELNAVLLLYHVVKRLLGRGVTARHLCDWCVFMHARCEEMDVNLLSEYIKGFHLEDMWNVFGRMAIKHLGLPENSMPCLKEGYEEKADLMMNYIMTSAPVRLRMQKKRSPSLGFWRRRYFACRRNIKRIALVYKIAPSQSVFVLWYITVQGIKQMFSDKR